MRKVINLVVLLIFFGIQSKQYLLADWIKMSNGINGGHVYSFALIGSAVFAGTENHGLYLSTNQGMSWKETDLGNITVFSLMVNGSSVFAGTNHGVYSSSNNGANWGQTSLTSGNGYSIIAIDSVVIVGTEGGVLRSTNYGQSWIPTSLYGFQLSHLP